MRIMNGLVSGFSSQVMNSCTRQPALLILTFTWMIDLPCANLQFHANSTLNLSLYTNDSETSQLVLETKHCPHKSCKSGLSYN